MPNMSRAPKSIFSVLSPRIQMQTFRAACLKAHSRIPHSREGKTIRNRSLCEKCDLFYKLFPYGLIIVNLAIEYENLCAVLVKYRLAAAVKALAQQGLQLGGEPCGFSMASSEPGAGGLLRPPGALGLDVGADAGDGGVLHSRCSWGS